MKKLLTFILGSILALNLSISVANSAAKEARVAYFLEWPSPNLEDMQKKNFAKALGVPVKWTNFSNGGAMTDAMLAGDIDRLSANIDPRIKLNIFFIYSPMFN